MMTAYNIVKIRHKFLRFCKINNANPQDILGYCEGSLYNFPLWYADYLKHVQNEIKYRIRTGNTTKIKFEDVWS